MEIIPYQKSFHDYLMSLHESNDVRDIYLAPPEIGYIVREGAIICAIGFLRVVEGNLAQIDTLVTNRELPSEDRHKALTLLIDTLISVAKQSNIKGIISFTKDEGILTRAKNIGFKEMPHKVIVLAL